MKALRFFLVVGLVAGVGCALPPSREAASGGAHHPSSAQETAASPAPETCDVPTGEHVWQDEIRYGWRGPRR